MVAGKQHFSGQNFFFRKGSASFLLPVSAVVLFLFFVFLPAAAQAHFYEITEVWAHFKNDGSYTVDIIVDAKALMIGTLQSTMTNEELDKLVATVPPEEVTKRRDHILGIFDELAAVRFDGQVVTSRVFFHSLKEKDVGYWSQAILPEESVRLTGRVRSGTRTFSFAASQIFGPVSLTVREEGYDTAVTKSVMPGMESEPYTFKDAPEDPGPAPWRFFGFGAFSFLLAWWHVLFLFALALPPSSFRSFFSHVFLFSRGFSITLQFAAHGPWTLHTALVAPMVALTLVAVALENIFRDRPVSWRSPAVFLFGLFHGFRLAEGLFDQGFTAGSGIFCPAAFNVGAIAGAFFFAGFFSLFLGPLRGLAWYRKGVVIPLSAVIAAASVLFGVRFFFA